MHFVFSIISFFSLLLIIESQFNTVTNLPDTYQRLASLYCYIDDYPSWLERKTTLNYFLQFSQFFYIDIDRIEQELEQYRLQQECLRALERLPIVIGGG